MLHARHNVQLGVGRVGIELFGPKVANDALVARARGHVRPHRVLRSAHSGRVEGKRGANRPLNYERMAGCGLGGRWIWGASVDSAVVTGGGRLAMCRNLSFRASLSLDLCPVAAWPRCGHVSLEIWCRATETRVGSLFRP